MRTVRLLESPANMNQPLATDGTVISIDGPVISTAALVRQTTLFRDVLGMQLTADSSFDAARTAQLFGLERHTARVLTLQTPGTSIGVQLVEFSPGSDTVIRPGGVGIASDALKMIDFFTSDGVAAADAFRRHGFELVTEGAPIQLPDGSRFIEMHVKGPEGVMVAAIHPENVAARGFVTVTDRLFSEVQSSSGPVSDFEPVRHFYESVLGIPMGYAYEFESPAFSSMIGAGRTTTIRANNYGRVVEDVMLGIIHYGLPRDSYESLRERARPPHLGVIGVRLSVCNLPALLQRCAAGGCELAVPLARVSNADSSTTSTAVVRGPHGVWHFLREHASR